MITEPRTVAKNAVAIRAGNNDVLHLILNKYIPVEVFIWSRHSLKKEYISIHRENFRFCINNTP
jgi:hypothetical protein